MSYGFLSILSFHGDGWLRLAKTLEWTGIQGMEVRRGGIERVLSEKCHADYSKA
jgi:hypothetical protein